MPPCSRVHLYMPSPPPSPRHFIPSLFILPQFLWSFKTSFNHPISPGCLVVPSHRVVSPSPCTGLHYVRMCLRVSPVTAPHGPHIWSPSPLSTSFILNLHNILLPREKFRYPSLPPHFSLGYSPSFTCVSLSLSHFCTFHSFTALFVILFHSSWPWPLYVSPTSLIIRRTSLSQEFPNGSFSSAMSSFFGHRWSPPPLFLITPKYPNFLSQISHSNFRHPSSPLNPILVALGQYFKTGF